MNADPANDRVIAFGNGPAEAIFKDEYRSHLVISGAEQTMVVDENGGVAEWIIGDIVFTQPDPSKRPRLVESVTIENLEPE